MDSIDKLMEYAMEELNDAEKYAKCSLTNKDKDKTLADMYHKLATEQLNHCELEEKQIERILSDPKLEHEWLRMVWTYQKNRMIDCKASINAMLSMFGK